MASSHTDALTSEHVVAQYQPIVELDSERTVALEALARLQQPGVGTMQPDEMFARFGDATDQITEAILNRVVDDYCDDGGNLTVPVMVNVTPDQVATPGWVDWFCHVRPGHLGVEVVEEAVGDPAALAVGVATLRRHGVEVALDDLGVGASNLARLAECEFSVIKIDRSVTAGVTSSLRHRTVVSTVVGMAESFDVPLVCEGVETQAQSRVLSDLGVEFGQGYHFARPHDPPWRANSGRTSYVDWRGSRPAARRLIA